MTNTITEIKVPRDCYKYGSGVEQSQNEGGDPYEVIGISTNEVIQLQIKDAMATWAVYASNQIMAKTNAIKSLFIESIKLLTRKQFILGTLFTIARKKERLKLIQTFNRQAFRIASVSDEPYYLKEWHLTQVSRELHWCIFVFLTKLDIPEPDADRFAEIFVHLLEYDNAYRFRFQDIMTETTKDELKTPRKAILRLIGVYKDRDLAQVSDKIIRLAKLLSYAMYIPKVKHAFLEVVEGMNLENLQYQEADIYWLCTANVYKVMGMTNEERKEYAKNKGWTYPSGLQEKML